MFQHVVSEWIITKQYFYSWAATNMRAGESQTVICLIYKPEDVNDQLPVEQVINTQANSIALLN